MADSYSISGHELRLDKVEETLEVWALADDETEAACEETFYLGPNKDGVKVWCDDGEFFVEVSEDMTLGADYPLSTWVFKHTVDGGILTIDIRDPNSVATPPPDVSYPLGNAGSYMILRIDEANGLLVNYNPGN